MQALRAWSRQIGIARRQRGESRRPQFWAVIAGARSGEMVTAWDRYLSWLEYHEPSDTVQWSEQSGPAPDWGTYWESQYLNPTLTGLSEWLANWQD